MLIGIDASQANRRIRSGTEWYAFHLIDEFKRLLQDRPDVKVRLYFRDEPRADVIAGLPENFEIRRLRWPIPYFWGQGRLSWEMLIHPPQILFCPAHTIPLIHPYRTFTTLHDVGFEDQPQLYDWLSRIYHRFSARFAARTAARIFTISEYSKLRIATIYESVAPKLKVIPLGCDLKEFGEKASGAGSVLSKYDLQAGKYILYIGRLEPKKNILGMIKAYELLIPKVTDLPPLVLAGKKVRTEDVEQYLASRDELRAKIKFIGYIDEKEKPVLYQNAAMFLFLTFYEGFGLPILEAQASSVPVVVSDRTSNPEVGSGAVVVGAEDAESASEAMRRLLTDQAYREEVVKAGLRNAAAYSWENTARQTLDELLK